MSPKVEVAREQARSFDRALFLLERLCALLGLLAVALILLAVVADAVLRWTINSPLTGLLEGAETLMVATVFLGVAYTQSANEHVRVDMLTSRLGTETKGGLIINLFGRMAGIAILLLIIWATGQRAIGELADEGIQDGPYQRPDLPVANAPSSGLIPYGNSHRHPKRSPVQEAF